MSMLNHKSMQVRCSMDQPMQLLVDKLSSKSSDLYIFWQNYNQLYQAYSQKITEVTRLQQEIDLLRREKQNTRAPAPPPEESFFKEKYLFMEKSVEDVKGELERLRNENREYKKQNSRYHDENAQLNLLLTQLREENAGQRNNIEKILSQLRNAQNQINTMTKVYQELGQKDMVLSLYMNKQKELQGHIAELEGQIDEMQVQSRETKALYEKLIKQSMINAKNKVMESLPGLIQTSKHKVQIVNP